MDPWLVDIGISLVSQELHVGLKNVVCIKTSLVHGISMIEYSLETGKGKAYMTILQPPMIKPSTFCSHAINSCSQLQAILE